MREILASLTSDAWVLDLGCQYGSFARSMTVARVIRFDLDAAPIAGEQMVRGTAACLPFAGQVFSTIIANHSLEHFDGIGGVVDEILRVLRPDGTMFISVPDASTITDRVYRWLARGGGHVNAFTSPMDVPLLFSSRSTLALSGMKTLHSGLSFLNRKNTAVVPRRLYLMGGGFEWSLRLMTYFFRRLDSLCGSRFSVYGWAYYFGPVASVDLSPDSNVCIRCGSGHRESWLLSTGSLCGGRLLPRYVCPGCGTTNFFTRDWTQNAT